MPSADIGSSGCNQARGHPRRNPVPGEHVPGLWRQARTPRVQGKAAGRAAEEGARRSGQASSNDGPQLGRNCSGRESVGRPTLRHREDDCSGKR